MLMNDPLTNIGKFNYFHADIIGLMGEIPYGHILNARSGKIFFEKLAYLCTQYDSIIKDYPYCKCAPILELTPFCEQLVK